MGKKNSLLILGRRAETSLSSSWNEFLCVEKIQSDQWEFTIRTYEVLSECDEYSSYDEEGNEVESIELPETIDGKKVIGVEDDLIVGGDLNLVNDGDDPWTSGPILAKNKNEKELIEFLENNNWELSLLDKVFVK